MKRFIEDTNPLKGFHYNYLDICIIKDNYIQGDHFKCDDWMIEFINESQLFLNKSKNQKYTIQVEQANKECDCISDEYQIDFKRLISKSYLYAKNKISNRITKCDNGMYVEHASSDNKDYKVYLLEKVCRFTEKQEFENTELIDDEEIKENICNILKIINTEKHLFCLFPIIVYSNSDTTNNTLENAVLYVNLCYGDLFRYRKEILPQYESYISFFFNKDFVITEFNGEMFVEKERIPKRKSDTFIKACNACGYSFMYNIMCDKE